MAIATPMHVLVYHSPVSLQIAPELGSGNRHLRTHHRKFFKRQEIPGLRFAQFMLGTSNKKNIFHKWWLKNVKKTPTKQIQTNL